MGEACTDCGAVRGHFRWCPRVPPSDDTNAPHERRLATPDTPEKGDPDD